jgi:hypothetical protein
MDSNLRCTIDNLQQLASQLKPGNKTQRLELLQSARALVKQLEEPHEPLMRMLYNNVAHSMATKVLSDLGVFQLLAKGAGVSSAEHLARETNADPRLVERLLKQVATEQFVEETGPDTYRANDITRCCATPAAKGAIDDMYHVMKISGVMPEFLRETEYANPIDKNRTAFKYAYKTDQHYFEYINTPGREVKLEAFRNHMDFKTVGQRWFEVPALMGAVFGDAKSGKDDVLLIDIGGAGGQDLLAFHDAQPSLPGRLILQDLPSSIDALEPATFSQQGVEIMGHNFFEPQPVLGAKAYYLKMCLHDWPDSQCSEILVQLKLAMTPGYSRIILDEIIVPDVKAGWFETSVDLLMMEVHSAQERREREWKALVDGVEGLKIKAIWQLEGSVNKIIEIEAV